MEKEQQLQEDEQLEEDLDKEMTGEETRTLKFVTAMNIVEIRKVIETMAEKQNLDFLFQKMPNSVLVIFKEVIERKGKTIIGTNLDGLSPETAHTLLALLHSWSAEEQSVAKQSNPQPAEHQSSD